MLFEETDTEESGNSQSDVSSLDDGFSRIQFESTSSEEQVTDDGDDDDMDSQVWSEIESESDNEFSEDYGMMEGVPAKSEDGVINPIDCYRHFITDEIIHLMVRETNRYAEQHIQTQKLTKRSKTLQWRPTTNEEMFRFLGIILEMGLVQMPEIDYYWSKRNCLDLKSSKIRCQEINLNYSSNFSIFRTTKKCMQTKTGCSS